MLISRIRIQYFLLAVLLFFVVTVVPYDSASAQQVYDEFSAWAWIGLPADQNTTTGTSDYSAIGFIHLDCASDNSCDSSLGNYPKVNVDTDTGYISGWAWLGAADAVACQGICASAPPASTGWLNFHPNPLPDSSTYGDTVNCPAGSIYPAPPCHAAEVDTVNKKEISGWARLETLAAYGDTILGTSNKNNDWGWVLLRGTNAADNQEFGLLYTNNSFSGWVFSGGGTVPSGSYDPTVGLGWMNFFPSTSESNPNDPYLSTINGDVYAAGGIINPNGDLSPTQYNATFLIVGNADTGESEFVNFTTAVGEDGTLGTYGALNLPNSENEYRSELGRLDFDKLLTTDERDKNAYNDQVSTLDTIDDLESNLFLDGQVYVLGDANEPTDTTVIIDHAMTFLNGTALSSTGKDYDGSGVFVINGNLEIDANLFYEQSSLVDVSNLASVAWIVRGNLTIGPNVSQLVGSFFVIGDADQSDGVVNNGMVTTEPASASQLVVYGLMMGQGFHFQRTYKGVIGDDQPAEFIYYDGRVLVNTPPGLRDFASTLPIFENGQ